ncbi:hypothetical protein O6H91_18G040300 [Diphasiastrum complanatum]|nr:hypothetical protein O6H91_18G040300 [Diphasiastrum complanatum]
MFGRLEAQYKYHEDIFFTKLKEGIKVAHDHSTLSIGLASGAVLLLLRRPRRLLFRYTIGRFRSEEVMLTNAEKKVKEMRQSIDILQNESKKLEERVRLAEEELVRGQTKLKNAGSQIRSLVRTVFKTESHARGLVDNLRELPGRDALRLRAEVASMAADAKQQRTALDKKIAKITKYGIPV